MSSLEFSEWMAYASEEPFGALAEARQAGVIAAAVYKAMGVGGRHKNWRALDFFPELALRPAGEAQPVEEQVAAIEAWNQVFGGKDERVRH